MKTNVSKTVLTMIMAAIVMIGMTGSIAAMNTNVIYNGDGQYECNYDATGTGNIGIHTYTSYGSDHLISGWVNSEASGWQEMDTYTGTAYNTDYEGMVIDREATVGGANNGEDEAGFIYTNTTDNNNNYIISYAKYHDNHGYGSHVTTTQTIATGSLINIYGSQFTVTGVVAETEINGFSYGSNTTVSGLVRTQTNDEYTYAIIVMDNGKMNLHTLAATGSVTPAFYTLGISIDGACGQWVNVTAKGTGVFGVGAGTNMHDMEFLMTDNGGSIYYYSTGTGVTVDMTSTFNGEFNGNGYVYVIDLTTPEV